MHFIAKYNLKKTPELLFLNENENSDLKTWNQSELVREQNAQKQPVVKDYHIL